MRLAFIISLIAVIAGRAEAKSFDLRCQSISHNVRDGRKFDIRFTNFYSVDATRHVWCGNKCDDPHGYSEGLKEWTMLSQPGGLYTINFDPKANTLHNETNNGVHREAWTETCRRIAFTGIRPKADRDR